VCSFRSSPFNFRILSKAPDIVVKSVETKLCEHLDREGLGLPYKEHTTVKTTVGTLVANQGGFLEGDLVSAVETISQTIVGMVKTCVSSKSARPTLHAELSIKGVLSTLKESSLSSRLQAAYDENLKQAELISELVNKNDDLVNDNSAKDDEIAELKQLIAIMKDTALPIPCEPSIPTATATVGSTGSTTTAAANTVVAATEGDAVVATGKGVEVPTEGAMSSPVRMRSRRRPPMSHMGAFKMSPMNLGTVAKDKVVNVVKW